MSIQEVQNHLKIHNINPSIQRVAIMKYLMEHKTHPTIDEIFNNLISSIPTLSKTTVYNTLKLFHEKKAVIPITIDEKNVRYDGNINNHAHFKCRKCGIIHDIELDDSEIPQIKDKNNYNLEETQVYFIGTCKNCG